MWCAPCTVDSDGRLSRCRFRVRDENSDRAGEEGWALSIDMKFELESGEERSDEALETSDSERLRLRTMIVLFQGDLILC